MQPGTEPCASSLVLNAPASKSFDYIARRGGVELHVEVKGLAGSLPQVLLTTN